MITRISKIARLPHSIREQLNRRLHNGEIGRTLLPWLNQLPETKKVLAELFDGKAITHQNLSEWRQRGYQDWLQHQFRLEWFDYFSQNETELAEHDSAPDTYEAMSRLFMFEVGQSVKALREIKNPLERTERLQNLMREFCRLQNSYNYSCHVQLDWVKYNAEPATEPEEENHPEVQVLPTIQNEPVVPNGAPISYRLTAPNDQPANPEPEAREATPIEPIPSPATENHELSIHNAPSSPSSSAHAQIPANIPAFQTIPTPSPTSPVRRYEVYHKPIHDHHLEGVDV